MWLPELTSSDKAKYLALVEAIARAIESGELKVGDRLPPQRQLAWKLGINPSTTMLAYREAARRHLIGGEVGRGTYVLEGSKEASLFLLQQKPPRQSVIDLSTNIPVADETNNDIQQTLLQLIADDEISQSQNYLSAELVTLAKVRIVEWLQQRGLQVTPAEVKICAGAQQALVAVLRSYCQLGEPILVEQYTAPGIKAASRDFLPLHAIAMDEKGILPAELDRLARATGAKMVVLTPVLQNPTAAVMDLERQQEIAWVIRKHDLLLLEDDVYGGLTEIPPLSALLPDRAILVSSFSKTVAAGLRVGFMVAKPALLDKIDPDFQIVNWSVSPLSLLIASKWIADGTALRRLAWQRQVITQRWRLAKKILASYMLGADVASPHIWLETAKPAGQLVKLCSSQGIQIVAADMFSAKRSQSGNVRISLAAAKNQVALKIALEKINQLLFSL